MKLIFVLILASHVAWAQKSKGGEASKSEAIWQSYQLRAESILHKQNISDDVYHENQELNKEREELLRLKYKEDESEELSNKVENHIKELQNKTYHKTSFVFIDWISWQREADLKSATAKNTLILTNRGLCAGGGWGVENSSYHAFVDGCFVYAEGNVSQTKNNLTYKQSNISTYGLKASIAAGKYISSKKAEVGFKIPLLYAPQSLENPSQPGVSVDDPKPFSAMASVYGRWPVNQWYFQTEFGWFLDQDVSWWSLGAGYKF